MQPVNLYNINRGLISLGRIPAIAWMCSHRGQKIFQWTTKMDFSSSIFISSKFRHMLSPVPFSSFAVTMNTALIFCLVITTLWLVSQISRWFCSGSFWTSLKVFFRLSVGFNSVETLPKITYSLLSGEMKFESVPMKRNRERNVN